MLRVKNLSYHYRGGPDILSQVSFEVKSGELLAILGNNGVGKSTILKCFNKILVPYSGKIELDGEDLLKQSTKEVAKKVAFVAQTIPSVQITVHDMVMLGRKPYMKFGFTEADHQKIHQVMAQLEIEPLRGRFLDQLSGGERQKVMLARAMAQEPRILLLDEPTSSLDIQNQYQVLQTVKEIVKEKQLIGIMVIHDLNLALRFCDRFLLIKKGQIYDFGDKAILDRRALLNVYKVYAQVVDVNQQSIVLVD